MNCNNKVIVIVVALTVILICVIGAFISVDYLGADNPVEKELEVVTEELIEFELHQPPGSLRPEVDYLFPHKE